MRSFSIIIPVYNAEKTILTSLESCVYQTYNNWEIILVDDCSTDSSISKINDFIQSHTDFSIRLLQNTDNKGPSYSRNLGWKSAIGDYIAFLDADDIWHPDKLMVMHHYINLSPTTELFFHAYTLENFISSPIIEKYRLKFISQLSILLKNPMATPCVCCKRDVPERFDEKLRYAEDHDLWVRIASRNPALNLIGPPLTFLARPILSPGGQSADRYKMRLGEIAMYRKYAATRSFSFLLFPLLMIFSLAKHVKSELKNLFISNKNDFN